MSTHMQVADLFTKTMKKDSLVLQQSCAPVCDQEDSREQSRHRECLRVVLSRKKIESLLTGCNAKDSRFCGFFDVNSF